MIFYAFMTRYYELEARLNMQFLSLAQRLFLIY